MNFKKLTAIALGVCMLVSGCGKNELYPDDSSSAIPAIATLAPDEATEAEPTGDTTTYINTTVASEAATDAESTAAPAPTGTEAPAPETVPVANGSPSHEAAPPPANGSGNAAPVTTAPSVNNTTAKKTTVTTTKRITTTTAATTTKNKNPGPADVLSELTLEQKVCQMFMVTPEALTGISPMVEVGTGTQNALKNYPVGGIIYFAQNLTSQSQIKTMINTTQKYSRDACGVGVFTAVDEEGGTVARCAQKLGTTSFNNMRYYGDLNDPATAYDIGKTLGKDLSSLGFNVDFAPVADVEISSSNELGSRIFSSDPYIVADMVSNVSKGLQDAGVCATLKHFPGLGAADSNTHTSSFVVIDRTVDQLRETEFVPFKAAIDSGADFVMVGHHKVTGFGDDLPCDLSYTAVTKYLRGELGFDGIAVTDSQQMNTISTVYGSGEAAILSIKAGMDIILMPADLPSAVDAVCKAVRSGEIPESRIDESVMRILRQKYRLGLLKQS